MPLCLLWHRLTSECKNKRYRFHWNYIGTRRNYNIKLTRCFFIRLNTTRHSV